jgi:uncharacterized protein (UPF0548 family)
MMVLLCLQHPNLLCSLALMLFIPTMAGGIHMNGRGNGHPLSPLQTWLPPITWRLFKPYTESEVDKLMQTFRHRLPNHDLDGAILANTVAGHEHVAVESPNRLWWHGSASYVIKCKEVDLGSGREVYERARDAVLAFRQVNSISWIKMALATHDNGVDTLATIIRCFGFVYSVNPCRVLARDGNDFETTVAFTTLRGHLIEGEERFRVFYRAPSSNVIKRGGSADSRVIFEMYSYSRGAGFLGTLTIPIIRQIQDRFFVEQAMEICRLVQAHSPRQSGA